MLRGLLVRTVSLVRTTILMLRTRAVASIAAIVRSVSSTAAASQIADGSGRTTTGIDCTCYFSENVFVRSPIEAHFTYEDETTFRRDNAALLANLTEPMCDELIDNLKTETERRKSQPALAAARKRRVAAEYTRLHPELWTLSEEWLAPEFIAMVCSAKAAAAAIAEGGSSADGGAGGAGGGAGGGDDGGGGSSGADGTSSGSSDTGRRRRRLSSPWQPPSQIADGVYMLPIFSRRFCTLMCEELDAFAASGLPCGQPNSMNRFGALLDELGFTPGLIDPLMHEYVRPLCAMLPPLAAVGGGSLDIHRAFVVCYRMGEDESLSTHFDNAEVTLNANLGLEFEGGELLFYGHKESAGGDPTAGLDWAEHSVGHGVLHLGQQVHAALPIESGERRNLVVWMRSSARRRVAGCPMCGETRRLLASAL